MVLIKLRILKYLVTPIINEINAIGIKAHPKKYNILSFSNNLMNVMPETRKVNADLWYERKVRSLERIVVAADS